ncbi:SprT family zinc-dependent metalloprotease [uncultured Jannaschia sp.]|uniref:M48 family metallopeptidase n=1 Tax=uncultured Jannaschia sp. TaxID=293347 RepID=UPI0026026BCC|nr:SprT family zinc-dependent metalloprotease [uncultured Jannaschia sp.]
MSIENLTIGGTQVEVHRKKIKNLHVGVYPPDGRIRVAAPDSISTDAIMTAVLTRMDWIRRRQSRFHSQERQSVRRYVSGETHYFLGRPLRLTVTECDTKVHRISIEGRDRLHLSVPADSTPENRRKWIRNWRRAQLRELAAPYAETWASTLKVAPTFWGIREMRTKWGSCNPKTGRVWLNLELSKKPVEAINYVVLHELAHLISPRHDERFIATLDAHMPRWRQIRSELNALPLSSWSE